MVSGCMDKAPFGKFGLVHAVQVCVCCVRLRVCCVLFECASLFARLVILLNAHMRQHLHTTIL